MDWRDNERSITESKRKIKINKRRKTKGDKLY